ncbi:MAG: AsmA family protein, partial [Acetobacteraceae bacterium]
MTGEDVAPPPPPSRRRPWLRICLGALAVMVVLLVGGGAILVWRLNPDTFKPRIIEAVRQATGRDISLNGPIGVKLSLLPTVQATDLALANPPGFSRPAMATLSQAEVQLNLLSLLRGAIIIDRVTLIRPDILLEVNDKGERNWNFTRATPPEEPAPPPGGGSAGQPRASHGRMAVHVGAVAIQDGKVAYRNAVTGRTATLTLPELTMSATDAAAPIRLAGRAAVNGTPLTIAATTGSLDALRDENPPHPWPVNATLTAGAATMKIDGALSHPLDGVGYSLSISADIPDLPALSPLAFGTELPPIRNIALTAKLAESKGPLPIVS